MIILAIDENIHIKTTYKQILKHKYNEETIEK